MLFRNLKKLTNVQYEPCNILFNKLLKYQTVSVHFFWTFHQCWFFLLKIAEFSYDAGLYPPLPRIRWMPPPPTGQPRGGSMTKNWLYRLFFAITRNIRFWNDEWDAVPVLHNALQYTRWPISCSKLSRLGEATATRVKPPWAFSLLLSR